MKGLFYSYLPTRIATAADRRVRLRPIGPMSTAREPNIDLVQKPARPDPEC